MAEIAKISSLSQIPAIRDKAAAVNAILEHQPGNELGEIRKKNLEGLIEGVSAHRFRTIQGAAPDWKDYLTADRHAAGIAQQWYDRGIRGPVLKKIYEDAFAEKMLQQGYIGSAESVNAPAESRYDRYA